MVLCPEEVASGLLFSLLWTISQIQESLATTVQTCADRKKIPCLCLQAAHFLILAYSQHPGFKITAIEEWIMNIFHLQVQMQPLQFLMLYLLGRVVREQGVVAFN